MIDYDVTNPSDPTCFRAPDKQTATLVTILIGRGQYAAKAIGPDGQEITEKRPGRPGESCARDDSVAWPLSVPFFMFGGFEEYWKANWPGETQEGIIGRRRAEVVAALRTVVLGEVSDRQLFDEACAAITDPDKLKAFVASWNDKKRSSMNDIMGRAHAYANCLEEEGKLEQAQA